MEHGEFLANGGDESGDQLSIHSMTTSLRSLLTLSSTPL